MPAQVADDFRSFTFRLRPGIFFADDPAFKGQARAGGAGLSAPSSATTTRGTTSELLYLWETPACSVSPSCAARPEGEALRLRPRGRRHPLAALDRFTFRVRLGENRGRASHSSSRRPARPPSISRLCVVRPMAPTSPLYPWAPGLPAGPPGGWRSSHRACSQPELPRVDLQPRRRRRSGARRSRVRWRAAPAAGRRVEISVIEESPAALAGLLDGSARPDPSCRWLFTPVAMPGGALAPHLAKRGVRAATRAAADMVMTASTCLPAGGRLCAGEGGAAPPIALAYDNDEGLRALRNGREHRGAIGHPPDLGLRGGYRNEDSARPCARHGCRSLRLPRPQRRWLAPNCLTARRWCCLSSTSSRSSRRGNELWRKHPGARGPAHRVRRRHLAGSAQAQPQRHAPMMWGYGWWRSRPTAASSSASPTGRTPKIERPLVRAARVRPPVRAPRRPPTPKPRADARPGTCWPRTCRLTITNDLPPRRATGTDHRRDTWVYTGVDMEASSRRRTPAARRSSMRPSGPAAELRPDDGRGLRRAVAVVGGSI